MKIIDKKYKMMNTNKIIVGYLAVVISLCMLLPLKAVSQGYAGPNKIMLKDSSVVIGGSGCSSCCYLSCQNLLLPKCPESYKFH